MYAKKKILGGKIGLIPKSFLYTPTFFLRNRKLFLFLITINGMLLKVHYFDYLFFIFQLSIDSFCRKKKALRLQESHPKINNKLFVFPLVLVV